jgi:hypothetical protein
MKKELFKEAQKLRRDGHSFREISEILKISKSTASLWVRSEEMTAKGYKRLGKLIESAKLKSKLVRLEKSSKYWYNLDRNCLVLKDGHKYSRNDLKVFLALLYWCEGSKTQKKLAFINSDPKLMSSYLTLLRSTFSIDEKKFRAFLHLHDYHNRKEMIAFWSGVTHIPGDKIHIYNKKNTGIRKKINYKGCISVTYNDYRIFDEIMLIVERFSNFFKK